MFRMLPVNYSLFFLQDTHPNIVECSYPGCTAVETMRHVLVECSCVAPVWAWHSAPWRQFGLSFTWTTISDLDLVVVLPQWQHSFDILRKLWALLVAVTLHSLWRHRNNTRFESKPPPTNIPLYWTQVNMSSSVVASTTPPGATALSPSGPPTDTMNPTLHDSVHLPGELQPLEAAGTTRAVRRETTGGSSDPHDPVARDAGEGDPAEAVLLGRRRRWSVRWILALSSLGTNHSAPKGQELSQHPVNSQSEISIQMLLKVTLCRPTRANLAKLMELASDEATSDDAMFQAIEDALPYPKRIGTTTFWIDTSDALMSQTNDKIIKSLFEDNKDAPWAHLMQDFVQVNKARGGDIVVTVTDEATRLGMSGQSIRLLGKEFSVVASSTTGNRNPSQRQHDDLHDLYYMDIVGTRFNFDARAVLNALRRLKTNPVFISYKLAYSSSTQKSNTHPNVWRVYFNTPSQPGALLVKGHPVDQIMLHGVHYGVFVEDYQPAPTRNGRRQTHCIDLDKLLVTPTTFPEPQTQEGENKRAKVHATDALPTPVPLQEKHSWTPTADTRG
ncbi:hypothetical protein DYB35_002205 [Aphanomyces astaci]|uniref:Uncharacterized protein n=1 Tax=Aphanomyces astaci TaxID=112090 RepID=A0A3R6WTQ3_APHAT|nr:hypothetical protein DYB35_002205 [Aphanomyces astaci]